MLEKRDLEMIAEMMRREFGGVKGDIAEIKADLNEVKADLNEVKTDLAGVKEELAGVKTDLAGVKEDLAEVKTELKAVSRKADEAYNLALETRLIMENHISRKIDIIGEGHDFLKQRLNEALQMEVKRERMELEMVNMRMDINKIKSALNIA